MVELDTKLSNKYILLLGSEDRYILDYIMEEWSRVASYKDKNNLELKIK